MKVAISVAFVSAAMALATPIRQRAGLAAVSPSPDSTYINYAKPDSTYINYKPPSEDKVRDAAALRGLRTSLN